MKRDVCHLDSNGRNKTGSKKSVQYQIWYFNGSEFI